MKRAIGCRWKSIISGNIYDPAEGDPMDNMSVPMNTPFAALPDYWVDPESGAPQSDYEQICE